MGIHPEFRMQRCHPLDCTPGFLPSQADHLITWAKMGQVFD